MTLEQVQPEYKCYNCQKTCIRGDPSLIRAVGNLYHKQCFKCNTCQISVIDHFFILDSSSTVILCERDYFQISRFKCHQCNQFITKNNYEVIGDYKYHRHCLHCPGCTIVKNLPPTPSQINQKEEESVERFNYNGRPYCRYHYSLIKGTECIGCGQTVLNQYMELATNNNNGKWHPECYMIMKYWHVELNDLQPILQSDYKSKQQLEMIQNEIEYIRYSIWKELSNFEDTTSKIISNIILFHQSFDYKREYESCLLLITQMNIIFSVLDLVFKYFTHLSCDVPTQKLSDQIVLFLDNLCQTTGDIENTTKLATSLSQYIRDLVKLSLQQTITLKRQNNDLIDQVLKIYSTKSFKQISNLSFLNHNLQLIDLSMSKLAFVLNIKPQQQGKRPDETIVYKPTVIKTTLFPPIPPQKRLVNSTPQVQPISLNRSNSTSKKQPDIIMTKNTSRMDTIRRALTTSRTKKDSSILNRSNSIFSSNNNNNNRREQKSFSLHNPSTPPLYISLPDVEQLHTTPPLSPPSLNQQQMWVIPNHLPDLTQQQDYIIRHIAVLYIESHVVNDYILLDDLLALLETNKKPSSAASLWGKLKTHILTPNETNTSIQPPTINNNEKKIGVSLSNLSNSSLNNQQRQNISRVKNFEFWKTHCPSVSSCFSSNSFAPSFIKDCILAMIDQDVNTEGIFRKSGNIRVLKEMCEQLDDAQHQRDDWLDFFKEQHIIQLAVFIKRYLRELPEPLLTTRLHKVFLISNNNVDNISIIHYAICLLPKINRDILLLVLSLLNWVAKHSSQNKMDFENLARVMAPNILYSHKNQLSSSADVSLCHGEIRVIATMIEYYDTFIKVPNDFTLLLENPKMTEYLCTNSIDLTCSKHFLKTYSSLLKVKKDIVSSESLLPPSPSTSTS